MAKKKTSTGLEVNYVRTDEKKLKKTISMADVRKDEGKVRSIKWNNTQNTDAQGTSSPVSDDRTSRIDNMRDRYDAVKKRRAEIEKQFNRIDYGYENHDLSADGMAMSRAQVLEDALEKLTAEEEHLKYLGAGYKETGNKFTDFLTQAKANYDLGRLGQNKAKAYAEYADNPTEEAETNARALSLLEQQFATQFDDVLDDNGAVLPWLSKSAAGYIPQAIDQAKGTLKGAVIGGLATAPSLNPFVIATGMKTGGAIGGGAAMYDVVRGSAIESMLNAGIDLETAKKAAQNEALLSSLIESAEIGVDFTTFGAGKWLNIIGSYAQNIATESLEEASQQGISIANLRRLQAGEDPSLLGLAKDTLGVYRDAITGEDIDARNEMFEAGKEGGKIAAVMGGVNRVGGAALNRAIFGDTAISEDNDPRAALLQTEKKQPVQVQQTASETENAEKGVLSDSGGISKEGVKLDSEEEIVAQRPQANSDDVVMEFARETVAKRQEYQQADREAIEYNVRKATGYGEQGVKAVADIVEKTNADTVEIDRAFRTAYETGLTGIERSKVELVNEIQEKAYTAGYLDYTAEMEKVKAKQVMVRKDGGVFPDDKKLYKNLPTQTYNSLNRIGKALGTAIVMDDTLKEHQQGYYNEKDGSIHISTNVENAVMEVFKHEVTHRMRELAPTEYAAFRSFVYESLNEGRMSSATLAEAKRAQYASMGVNEDISGSIDEVVAAFTEELFADEQKLHNFIAEVTGDETKRSWAQKFFDIIREVIDKVKGALRKGDTSIADSIKQLEKAEQMWKDAIKASIQNVQNTQSNQAQKNTADGDVKPSLDGIDFREDKYSLKDSSDRELTKEQQEFYADSKILDKDGNLLVLYHGTGADFTVFDTKRAGQNYGEWSEYGKGIYLTPSTKLARYYAENARGSKTKTMELYANIENPFNVTKAVDFDIDDLAQKYGLTEFDVSFLKRAGYRLTDFLRDHNEDITAYLTSKGHDGLWDMERGKATQVVAYEANQVKNVDNENPTDNPDIRFSLKSPREKTKNLIALHNLNAAKLKKVLGLGGFPMPSIAVTRTDIPHTNFGDITLIMNKSTVDPKANRKNTVYSADAWTPTVPPISYKPSETRLRDIKKTVYDFIGGYEVADKLDHISFDAGNISNALDRYDGDLATGYKDNSTLQYAFLKANDADFELPMTEEKLYRYGEVSNEAVKYFAGHVVHGLQTIRQYRQMGGAEMMQNEALLTAVADALNWDVLRELEPDSKAYKKFEKKPLFKADEVSFSKVEGMLAASEKYFNGGIKQTIDSREASKALKRHIADNGLQEQYEAWLTDLFDGVIEKTGIYNNKDVFTPSGNRRTFEQLHMPVTVENIVKAMASQNGGKTKNIAGFNGVKTLRAGMAKRFKNIAEMHKLKDRLQNLTEEEFETIHKELSDRMYEIINRIIETGVESSGNVYIRMDSVGEMLMEIAESGKYTIDSIVTHFETYQYKIGNSLADDIKELLFDVSQMPTNMFEAKPARVVGFDEVLAAIVPDDTEHSLVEKLQAAGVENVMTYKKGDDAERLALANSVEDARFSLKEDKDILKENAKLKEINAALKNQFKVTKFAKVDKKALERFTKQLLKDYSSQADAGETRLMLDGLYQYMANGENGESAVWEDVYKQAREIANDVLRKSVEVDDEMYREYADLRKYLRETPISISSEDVADIDGVESLQEFRKKYWGRIRISNDGIRIDDIYSELAAEYPALFDAETETHPGVQLARIGQVLDEMQPTEYNPYKSHIGQMADLMAYDIVDRFFELPQAKPTFADKAEQKLTETRIREGKKLEKLREQKNERIKQLIAEGREKTEKAVLGQRIAAERDLRKLKAKQEAREERMNENRKKAVLRKRIENHVKKLSAKLLNPNDNQHIPDQLRGVVNKLLESINLESNYETVMTLDGDVRVKPHTEWGAKATKRSHIFSELHQKYIELAKQEALVIDPQLLGDGEIQGLFTQVIAMGDTYMADMTVQELDTLWQVIRAVEHSISHTNKLLAKSKFAGIKEWAYAVDEDIQTRRERKGRATEKFRNSLENPYTFFSHLGNSGKAIFRMLRNAQDAQQTMAMEIATMVEDVVDSKTARKLEREVHNFTTERGHKLTLTTSHVMEIYVLSKQEDAMRHMMEGGIHQPEIKHKNIKRDAETTQLSLSDINKLIGLLSEDQCKIADGLQEIMSTKLAEYGNEASMKAYGYKKFTKSNYWTIRSAKEGIHFEVEKGANLARSIRNIGLAKNRNAKANNPLDIGGVFYTFSSHAANMIDYAAWLCPMEDLTRLYNFKFKDDNARYENMQVLVKKIIGDYAGKYWENLVRDIQNGTKAPSDDPWADLLNKMAGKYRAATVGANVRVILQQFTAFFKAAAVMNPLDLAQCMTGGGWKAALKHSPTAQRKANGGFDMGASVQMYDSLFDGRTKLDKFNDFMMAGAGVADALTWGRLWNACEHQIKRTKPELQPKSDAFYKAVDEVFADMIDQTQVSDGVLQRPNVLRSQSEFLKQAMAYQGEPLMAVNMVIRAYDDFVMTTGKERSAAFRKLGRSATALIATNAVNAVMQSLVDAWRDDDEDKKYWERFWVAYLGITGDEETKKEKIKNFILNGNIGSSLNPAGYMPIVKDILSIAQGYTLERADTSGIGEFINAVMTFNDAMSEEGKKTRAYAFKELTHTASRALGISATNLLRDIWGVMRSYAIQTDDVMMQYQMEKAILKVGNEKNNNAFVNILYRAYNADQEMYQAIYDDMVANGIDAKKIATGMESRMKKAQGVEKVSDLEERYLSPTQEKEYKQKNKIISNTNLWKSAADGAKNKIEDYLYDIVMDKDSDFVKKVEAAAEVDIDDTEYLLYKLALEMYDKPTENGKYGTFTQEEAENAISELDGLTDAQRAYLWQNTSKGWNEKKNPWK